ncbi:MAG TPA: hypothetical protein VII98_08695 [Solirubrobacteraceae bacterium]
MEPSREQPQDRPAEILGDREFVVAGDEQHPFVEAVVDVEPRHVAPLADALSAAVGRFSALELTSTEDVVRLARVRDLHDRFAEAALAQSGLRPRLTFALAQALTEAASAYVGERDVESYQSPEERERIAVLRELTGPLFDLTADCHRAADELQARIDDGLPVFLLRR